jgi:hypothetical protein
LPKATARPAHNMMAGITAAAVYVLLQSYFGDNA